MVNYIAKKLKAKNVLSFSLKLLICFNCCIIIFFYLIFKCFPYKLFVYTENALMLLLPYYFIYLLFVELGMAGPAEYKSEPAGKQADSYLLEWTVVSYTPVTAFKVEIREVGTTAWRESSAKPIEDGPYHYAGKEFLKDLTYATRYEARVQARNDEGWSKTKEHFYFATEGAGLCALFLFLSSLHFSLLCVIIFLF